MKLIGIKKIEKLFTQIVPLSCVDYFHISISFKYTFKNAY